MTYKITENIINNVNNVTVCFNYENRTVHDLWTGFYCFNFSDNHSSAIYMYKSITTFSKVLSYKTCMTYKITGNIINNDYK